MQEGSALRRVPLFVFSGRPFPTSQEWDTGRGRFSLVRFQAEIRIKSISPPASANTTLFSAPCFPFPTSAPSFPSSATADVPDPCARSLPPRCSARRRASSRSSASSSLPFCADSASGSRRPPCRSGSCRFSFPPPLAMVRTGSRLRCFSNPMSPHGGTGFRGRRSARGARVFSRRTRRESPAFSSPSRNQTI